MTPGPIAPVMRWRAWRAVFSAAILAVGLALAAIVFDAGWQLPHTCDYEGGDSCVASTFEIDWSRVDWSITPDHISCGGPTAGPGDVVIGPGDECLVSQGDRIVSRASYEDLRRGAARRRLLTLTGVGILLAAATAAVVLVHQAR